MLKKIDSIVLAQVERVAHFIQRNFGVHPIAVAMIGDILFACCVIARWFIPGIVITPFWRFFDVFLFLFIFYETIVIYPWRQDEADYDAARGVSNPNKTRPFQIAIRVLILGMFLLDAITIWIFPNLRNINGLFASMGLFVAMYFAACDPLPPGSSRLGKWLASFGKKPALSRTS